MRKGVQIIVFTGILMSIFQFNGVCQKNIKDTILIFHGAYPKKALVKDEKTYTYFYSQEDIITKDTIRTNIPGLTIKEFKFTMVIPGSDIVLINEGPILNDDILMYLKHAIPDYSINASTSLYFMDIKLVDKKGKEYMKRGDYKVRMRINNKKR